MHMWDVLYPDPALAWMEGLKGVTWCRQLPLEILCLLVSAPVASEVIQTMALQCGYRSEWIPPWPPCQHWHGVAVISLPVQGRGGLLPMAEGCTK